ncbi:MAG TPA: hypothetical protein VK773_06465, partial [Acidimicrobiales bacterium]|nr:hypothetical protein [Acidimicrobiales bacterium]
VGEGASETPVTDNLAAATAPLPPTAVLQGAGIAGVTGAEGVASAGGADAEWAARRFSWKAIAGTAAVVFLLALGLLTAVELIANKPLASIFGSTGSGPTLKNIFTPGPTASTTTTTTPPASTTTSTSSPTASSTTTTTTTTAPSSTTTSTTTGSTTTTTNNLKSTTTSTTASIP